MATSDRILERLRKLLAVTKTDSGASQGEIDNALAFAQQIMKEHDLSEADVLLDKAREPELYESLTQAVGVDRSQRLEVWDGWLAWCVCHVCGVRWYFWTGHEMRQRSPSDPARLSKRCKLWFYGLPHDVAVAVAMYAELQAVMKAMSVARLGPGWKPHHWDYCRGFALRLNERGRQLVERPLLPEQTGAAATCSAIVLKKDAMLDRYGEEKLKLGKPKKKARSVHVSNPIGFMAGQADANHVDLSPQKAEPRRKLAAGGGQ